MFYHRLLSGMLSSCVPRFASRIPFSFDDLWEVLGIDPSQEFTSSINSRLRRVEAPPHLPVINGARRLSDLVDLWHRYMKGFHVVEVVEELTLVYYNAHRAGEMIEYNICSVVGLRCTERERASVAGACLIGRVRFRLDNVLLDRYSGWILSWWRGDRSPQGVRGELVRRCRYAIASNGLPVKPVDMSTSGLADSGTDVSGRRILRWRLLCLLRLHLSR